MNGPGRGAPTPPSQRIGALDAVRGFAVLGILPMNVFTGFALHTAVYFNPAVQGGFDRINYAVWLAAHLLFDLKMMAIFSMLFGAGMMLLVERAAARSPGLSAAPIYYKRLAWLLLIGLAHAYLLWFGDILFTYALCGAALYPLRRIPPSALAATGCVLIIAAMPIWIGFGVLVDYFRAEDPEVWEAMREGFDPTPEQIEAESAQRLGTYPVFFLWNAVQALTMQTVVLAMFSLWRVLGLMMLGMALMKWGVFTASRPRAFYAAMTLLCYGIGLPAVALGAHRLTEHGFDTVYVLTAGWWYNYLGSIPVALGHVGLFMLIATSGIFRRATAALAAVGRMALSNYLLQSIICVPLFAGWGLGLFGQLDRIELAGVIAAIWAFQLIASPLWLARFRFGPAEWIWRTLTYGRPQPMRAPPRA